MAKPGPGARIGDQFQLIRKIGEGGCGEVYLAEQTSLGRNAVVKLMHPELSRDPSYVARFRREAQLAARLTHHHTASIYAFGEMPERVLWIAMEYIEGESLHNVLAKEPARAIADLLTPIADVLDRAGNLGIIHRDVKPDNILVSPESGGGRRAVLLDFGLARPMEDNDKLTAVGVAVGSPTYMSPEQVFGPSVDSATDRYAFGVILYIAVAKRPPFRHDDRVQLVLMHKRQPVPSLSTILPALPSGHALDRFFTKALAKQPQDRHPSARQMIQEFIEALDDSPLGKAAEAPAKASRPPPPRPTSSGPRPPATPAAARVPSGPRPSGRPDSGDRPQPPAEGRPLAPPPRPAAARPDPSPPQPSAARKDPAPPRPAAASKDPAPPRPSAARPDPSPPRPTTARPDPSPPRSTTARPDPSPPRPAAASKSPAPPRPTTARSDLAPPRPTTARPDPAPLRPRPTPIGALLQADAPDPLRSTLPQGQLPPLGAPPAVPPLETLPEAIEPPTLDEEPGGEGDLVLVEEESQRTDPTMQTQAALAKEEVEEQEEEDAEESPPLPGHSRLLAGVRDGERALDILCGGEALLGKHRDCELVCRAFPTPEQDAITHGVSRQHARLRVASGKLLLEDLGSLNGTFLDDKRISGGPVPLYDEARLRLGPVLTLEVRLFKSGAALLRRVDAYHGGAVPTLLLWDKLALGEPILGLVPQTGDSVTRWGVMQCSRPGGELWWGGPKAVEWRRGDGSPGRPQALQPDDELALGDLVIGWRDGVKPGLGGQAG